MRASQLLDAALDRSLSFEELPIAIVVAEGRQGGSASCPATTTMADESPPAEPSGASPPPPPQTVSGSPTEFLKGVVGKRVVVRLSSGVDYRGAPRVCADPHELMCVGILSCLDGYMNIALEQTEEHVGGRVTNRYGDTFIRGNNGMSLQASVMLVVLTSVRQYYISLLQNPYKPHCGSTHCKILSNDAIKVAVSCQTTSRLFAIFAGMVKSFASNSLEPLGRFEIAHIGKPSKTLHPRGVQVCHADLVTPTLLDDLSMSQVCRCTSMRS